MNLKRYGMYLRNEKDLIHLTQQETKEQAAAFFADIKKIPIKKFNKIFIIKAIKNDGK